MKKNKLILDRQEIINVLGKEYKNLADIFSDKFGIVNAMLERHELDKYNLHMYQCLSANTVSLFDLSREVSSGGLGVNESQKIAMTSCLAEALERYCMSYIPQNEIIKDKKENLKKKYIFDNYFLYSDAQYKELDLFLNPNSENIEWTKIYNINNKTNFKYWPASLIYLPFDLNKTVAETTSTGMAAGFTLNECFQSGLLELIERDALMINFMQRLNPPQINIKSINGDNKKLIKMIQKEYNIKIYKLYSDIKVPIYLSIIYKNEKNSIHYGIGACASLDSDYAINKSLKECLFTYFYSLNIMDVRQDNPNKIKTLYEHFLYYQGKNFNQLLFDSKIVNYEKEKVTFDKLLKELKKINIDVYYSVIASEYNITIDDLFKRYNWLKDMQIDPNKIHLEENHQQIYKIFDEYNKMLNKNNIEYYYTSGILSYLLVDKKLERYHHDLDVFVNMDDLIKLEQVCNDYNFLFERKSGDREDGTKRIMLKMYYKDIMNIPITVFMYVREKDNLIIQKDYFIDKNGENFVEYIYNLPSISELSFSSYPKFHNGIKYYSITPEALFLCKSENRPKDIYDCAVFKHIIDINKLKKLEECFKNNLPNVIINAEDDEYSNYIFGNNTIKKVLVKNDRL